MIFKVIVMLCAVGMSPSDCGRGTAYRYFEVAEVHDEIACGHKWQEFLAGSGLEFNRKTHYTKVACVRMEMTTIAKGNVG